METKRNSFPLPCELVVEILLKLPIKSLVRFRSVSNPWSCIILDTQFAKSHFDLAIAPTHKLLYMTKFCSETRLIDVDTSICRDCAVIQPPVPHNFDIKFIDSCRGFILLANDQYLILWNPSTGVHKPLSYTSTASNALRSYKKIGFWCGFGYDTPNDDYLVVLGWESFGETPYQELKPHLQVFSTKTNSWKETEGIHLASFGFQSAVLFNGIIHWLRIHHDGHAQAFDFLPQVIITFDLVGNNFSKILLPDKIGGFFDDLKILGGCLSVSYYYTQEDKVEIWVMKEYNIQSSWTKLNVILPYKRSRNNPLCFTKSGELVATNDRGHLVKFNDRAKYVEFQPECPSIHTLVVFTETLLSLPGKFGEATDDGN